MLHIKNCVHFLWVKWMHRLCTDVGSSWSRFIWHEIERRVPAELFTGLRLISESVLTGLTPFYSHMLRSYAFVNDLMYHTFDTSDLPQNLWGGGCPFPADTHVLDQSWFLHGC